MRGGATAGLLTFVVGGCVGQNPWWDPPADGGGESASDDGESSIGDRGVDTGADATGFGETTGADSTGGTTIFDVSADGSVSASASASADDGSAGTESTTTDDGESTDAGSADEGSSGEGNGNSGEGNGSEGGGSDSSGPSCDPPQALCDGECFDVSSHPHHCGAECIDCMDLLGPGSHCEAGECAEGNGGGNDDDDDD